MEGLIIDWADHQGQTPLHYAVRGGRLPLVQLLLDAGADPSLADKHNLDPEEYVLAWYCSLCIGADHLPEVVMFGAWVTVRVRIVRVRSSCPEPEILRSFTTMLSYAPAPLHIIPELPAKNDLIL